MSKYTTKYFIEFFSAIPDENWKVGSSFDGENTGCAITHAFRASSECGNELVELFGRANLLVSSVNDCGDEIVRFPQETPKARILAALEYLDNLKK